MESIDQRTKAGTLSFHVFSTRNANRGNRWHDGGIQSWTIADWGVAMAGEAGEACNAIKKLRRIETSTANMAEDPTRLLTDKGKAIQQIGEELADTVIYCDLLCARLGISLEEQIRAKFNKTSELYGFPERL